MKFIDEYIASDENIREQIVEWKGMNWRISCNDRFEPDDFKAKVHCEICGPEKFVPKVLNFRGHRLCNSCLVRMSEMLQVTTLIDCAKDRHDVNNLKQALIAKEMGDTVRKI